MCSKIVQEKYFTFVRLEKVNFKAWCQTSCVCELYIFVFQISVMHSNYNHDFFLNKMNSISAPSFE